MTPPKSALAPHSPADMTSARDRMERYELARKRAERRIEEREHLRLELKAREYIQTIHGIVETLIRGTEDYEIEGKVEALPLGKTRVAQLKTAGEFSLRMLDRVLPPLKAVEVSDSPEKQADAAKLSTSELMHMVLEGRRLAAVDGEYVEVEAPESQDETRAPWD